MEVNRFQNFKLYHRFDGVLYVHLLKFSLMVSCAQVVVLIVRVVKGVSQWLGKRILITLILSCRPIGSSAYSS